METKRRRRTRKEHAWHVPKSKVHVIVPVRINYIPHVRSITNEVFRFEKSLINRNKRVERRFAENFNLGLLLETGRRGTFSLRSRIYD